MEIDIKKELGSLIKRRRKQLGLSQEALAERADLHRTYVTDIERGSRNISIESISKLATALEVSIGALFLEGTSSENQSPGSPQGAANGVSKSVGILLVEDDPRDVELTLEGFRNARLTNPVEVVRDGAEALDFLFQRGEYRSRSKENFPQIVLLDLGLPKMHGIEVLRQIRANEQTRDLKVVVLSASRRDEEVREAMNLGASAYLFKPVDFQRFSEITPLLNFCWTLRKPTVSAGQH
jgi:two-component system response regulator